MINVLSLFDGISCGQVALERAGIKVNKYFASEIDKYTIQITQKNHPNTIQIGDVKLLKYNNLPEIYLLMGGSPCQGFSIAGKQLNFEDDRSKLFFEFVKALKELKPKYFLLENVPMKKEFEDIISEQLGVKPIEINSGLLSAQNRKRLYWTNIPGIKKPEDKGINFKDILQEDDEVENKYWLSEEKVERIIKSMQIKNKYIQFDLSGKGYKSQQDRLYFFDGKMPTIPAANPSNKMNVIKISKKGVIKKYQEKLSTLTGGGHSGGNHSDMDLLFKDKKIRRATPIECERAQTLPDNYTEGLSDSQRYKCLGNGWTIEVIKHIFKNLPCTNEDIEKDRVQQEKSK